MSDINEEYGNLLADFAKNSTNFSQSADPAPADIVTSEVAAGTETPEVEQVMPVTTDNVSVPATPVEAAPVNAPVDAIIDDWDGPATPEVVTPQAATAVFDFSELGKAVGADVKTKDELVSYISKIKAESETIQTGLKDLPKELTKAIELAKQGGDYLSYLKVSSVDYGKLDPVDVYEEYVIDRSADAQGNVDFDKVNAFLDSLQEVDKELRGKEIIKNLQAQQNYQAQQIEAEATKRKQEAVTSVQSVLSTIDDVNGFKLKPSHKQEIFDWVTSGKMMKDAFYSDKTGDYDFNKVVKAAIILKYGEKMDAYRKQQARNAAKREILDELQNPEVTRPAVPAAASPKKGYDISDYLEEVKNRTRY